MLIDARATAVSICNTENIIRRVAGNVCEKVPALLTIYMQVHQVGKIKI